MEDRMKKQLDNLIKLTIKPAIWEDVVPCDDDDCIELELYNKCIEYIKENL